MSPTASWSSSRIKRPVITSRTNAWLPKPIATPTMPAPASNGAMSMPRCERMISPAMTTISDSIAVRNNGSIVRIRVRRGTPPLILPR